MEIIQIDLTIETIGLEAVCGYELSATVASGELISECSTFIKCVADYITTENTIKDGETFAYGYWLTKLFLSSQKKMIFWEFNLNATKFVFGVTNTLNFWKEQHACCAKVNTGFQPPNPEQLVVVSEGVFEGDEVEGVRYPSPSHMSGWWLTTDRYNGDVKSLTTHHIHHISEKRPDLAKFFALPFGYRFFSPTQDVWKDIKIKDQ